MVSHSEISTYLDCQRKWELVYKYKIRQDNPHFQFGSMAHKVMETRKIPNEDLYPELKDFFHIRNWKSYFTNVLYEVDEFLKDKEILYRELKIENEDIRGIIDLVVKDNDYYYLFDYKFSVSVKDLEDLNIDQQLYIYAASFALKYNIPLCKIKTGYINIKKTDYDEPRMLKNGTLSKDKSQLVSSKKYLEYVEKLNLDVDDYKDVLIELDSNKIVICYYNFINMDMMMRIMSNIDNVITDMKKGYVLEQFSCMCKKCNLYEECKSGRYRK